MRVVVRSALICELPGPEERIVFSKESRVFSQFFKMIRNTNKKEIVGAIYEEHSYDLFRWASKYVSTKSVAYDLIHTVFIKLLEKPEGIDTPETAKLLLFKMFHDAMVDEIRRDIRWSMRGIDTIDDQRLLQLPRQEEELVSDRLRGQQLPLPDPDRTVFSLAYFQGEKDSEIARIMGLKLSTVRYSLKCSRKIIRKILRKRNDLSESQLKELLRRRRKK